MLNSIPVALHLPQFWQPKTTSHIALYENHCCNLLKLNLSFHKIKRCINTMHSLNGYCYRFVMKENEITHCFRQRFCSGVWSIYTGQIRKQAVQAIAWEFLSLNGADWLHQKWLWVGQGQGHLTLWPVEMQWNWALSSQGLPEVLGDMRYCGMTVF